MLVHFLACCCVLVMAHWPKQTKNTYDQNDPDTK
jgi:hypothetical protein